MARSESNSNTSSKKKITTVVLLGPIVLALCSTVAQAAVPMTTKKIPHKPDLSHPKGTSPWPKFGETPETHTPEVKAWVKMVDWSKVPKLPIRKTESPGEPPECPKHVSDSDCWWTCTGCFAKDDVYECPVKNEWGLTFDDGPEPGVTEEILGLLKEKNVTATFFVTGMKSSKAPWLLQDTLDQGHHLASHTWSHSGLTTLTNEEIVAELMWTQKYIYDHTGYKVKYFRPPYGDIDNRVRGIARELGFKTVIWGTDWDTQDWQLQENTITPKEVVGIFKSGLKSLPKLRKGVITLEHDGDNKMANMARTLLDMGLKKGLHPMNIAQCLNDKVGYNEVPAQLSVAAPAPAKKPAAPAPAKKPAAAAPAVAPTVVKPDADIKKAGGVEAAPQDDKEQTSEVAKTGVPEKSSASIMSAGLSVAGWTLAAIVASYVF
ncbi:chitin deacetylase [Linnemannia zychae]|nr:chitin deacetylase [Linnemannia zychae]